MADKISLEVVTPFRTVLNEDVDSVTLPGIEGEMGILPEHVPLLTTLDAGIMSYVNGNGKTQAIAVHWGYAQVDGNNVRVRHAQLTRLDYGASHLAIDYLPLRVLSNRAARANHHHVHLARAAALE